jgi:hypothetical protein
LVLLRSVTESCRCLLCIFVRRFIGTFCIRNAGAKRAAWASLHSLMLKSPFTQGNHRFTVLYVTQVSNRQHGQTKPM